MKKIYEKAKIIEVFDLLNFFYKEVQTFNDWLIASNYRKLNEMSTLDLPSLDKLVKSIKTKIVILEKISNNFDNTSTSVKLGSFSYVKNICIEMNNIFSSGERAYKTCKEIEERALIKEILEGLKAGANIAVVIFNTLIERENDRRLNWGDRSFPANLKPLDFF